MYKPFKKQVLSSAVMGLHAVYHRICRHLKKHESSWTYRKPGSHRSKLWIYENRLKRIGFKHELYHYFDGLFSGLRITLLMTILTARFFFF